MRKEAALELYYLNLNTKHIMKKTLIALMALAGVAMADSATLTVAGDVTGQEIGYGFIISPTDSFVEYSGEKLLEMFQLESVTLPCSATGGTYASSAKLAVFERAGSDAAGYFVGISGATTHSTGDVVYSFSEALTLDTTKQYQFLFVSADTEASAFSTTVTNQEAFAAVAVASRFDRCDPAGSLPKGDGVIYNNSFSDWAGQNMAKATLNGQSIPEPATATLSLLALAGLAARRRRK